MWVQISPFPACEPGLPLLERFGVDLFVPFQTQPCQIIFKQFKCQLQLRIPRDDIGQSFCFCEGIRCPFHQVVRRAFEQPRQQGDRALGRDAQISLDVGDRYAGDGETVSEGLLGVAVLLAQAGDALAGGFGGGFHRAENGTQMAQRKWIYTDFFMMIHLVQVGWTCRNAPGLTKISARPPHLL